MSRRTSKERRCCKCGAKLSPFMGKKCWENHICQNCDILFNDISDEALAKNGLTRLDFM